MSQQARIKCYVTLNADPPLEEIRLFKVDRTSESGYDDLIVKILDCYRSQGTGFVFSLSWTDVDGDEIVVSSNGELTTALGDIEEGGTLKMKILAQKRLPVSQHGPCYNEWGQWGGWSNKKQKKNGRRHEKPVANWDNPAMTHPGITCDGCEGPVMGPRWKCSICPDYDLCKPCKRNGTHQQHIFYKIPFRLRNSSKWLWRRNLVCSTNAQNNVCEVDISVTTTTTDETNSIPVDTVQETAPDSCCSPTSSVDLIDITEDLYISDKFIDEPLSREDHNSNVGDNDFVMLNDTVDTEPTSLENIPSLYPDMKTVHEAASDTVQQEAASDTVHQEADTVQPETASDTLQQEADDLTVPNPDIAIPLPAPTTCGPAPAHTDDPAPTQPPTAATPSWSVYMDSADPRREPQTSVTTTPTHITTLILPPHVHAALGCMIEMGYSNRGEWLAKLLLNKNGDINAVIDILNARNRAGHNSFNGAYCKTF